MVAASMHFGGPRRQQQKPRPSPPSLKCLPGAAPHRTAARARCFQLTLKKLQFLYFIGMSSFLVKATSVE